VDRFHDALRRADTETAQSLLAEDALIFEAGGAERGKAEYAAEHLAADAAFSKAVPTVITRRAGRVNGKLAWIATEGRMTGTFNGKPVDQVTTETMVVQQGSDGWRIVHIHWSSAAARPNRP
jgi:ketosteroid isomerase-like protein